MMACCELNIGAMRNRVAIKKPNDDATVGAGGHVDLSSDANWTKVATRWAEILTRGGTEGFRFKQTVAEVTKIVRMYSDSMTRGMLPRWRIEHTEGGRIHRMEIVHVVDVDMALQVIEAHCKEVVS